jgi:hypothetical protein
MRRGLHAIGESLQLVLLQTDQVKKTGGQAVHRHCDDDLFRPGEPLKRCCQVWRVADDGLLLRGALQARGPVELRRDRSDNAPCDAVMRARSLLAATDEG